jgi:hypothetical protein
VEETWTISALSTVCNWVVVARKDPLEDLEVMAGGSHETREVGFSAPCFE